MQLTSKPEPKVHLNQQMLIAEVVSQINQHICAASSFQETLDFACQRLAQTLKCSSAQILLPQDNTVKTLVVCGECSLVAYTTGQQDILLSEAHPSLQMVLTQLEPITWTQCHFAQSGEEVVCSVLAIAVRYGGQVNSVIKVQQCAHHRAHHQPREWGDWECQLLQEVAAVLAIAINYNLLHTEMKHRIVRESLLRLVTNQIRSSLDLTTILKTIVHQVRELLNTDRVVIYQFQHDWQGVVVVEDVIAPWQSVLGEMGQDNCFSAEYAELYRGGRVRGIPDVQQAGLDECHVHFLRRLQVQANLIVPILQNDTTDELSMVPSDAQNVQLWGLLIAHECRSPRHWQTWEMDLLKQLGDQIAIAIQQAELYSQVRANAARSQAQAEQLQTTLEELRSTQIQLIQSEKLSSLGQMVAGIAHEINNAINFIHANLPYVQQYAMALEQAIATATEHPPKSTRAIATLSSDAEIEFVRQDFPNLIKSMQTGTGRIRDIVTTLRNFSRLDEAVFKAVDLHEGIDSSLVILRHRLGPQVQIYKDYGILPLVECYAGQINQVFLNLLSNALDAAGPSAEITIRTCQSSANTVIITIRDNGPGIPDNQMTRIFDPFFTTKPIGQGTGLGLSICYQLVVKNHQGAIRCVNLPDRGVEFQVELPISRR